MRRPAQKKRERPENNKLIVAVNRRPVFHFKEIPTDNSESSRNIIPQEEN
jgi:hypothetical protein